MGIKKAKTKELKTVSATTASGTPAITLERVYLPEKQKKTEMLTGSPAEIAAKIVEKLKFEVRVI
jgi:electron transfer flavoprotein beta subunit